ncbi:MAG: hypothetical protein MZV70_07405 [Desulfobacterales bacterium]|nr:hypothetical protein [Desulfobacterales bacterium]
MPFAIHAPAELAYLKGEIPEAMRQQFAEEGANARVLDAETAAAWSQTGGDGCGRRPRLAMQTGADYRGRGKPHLDRPELQPGRAPAALRRRPAGQGLYGRGAGGREPARRGEKAGARHGADAFSGASRSPTSRSRATSASRPTPSAG